MSKFEAVIGIEVHAQLATKSKLFCGCPVSFGDSPNDNICPICCGHPGALPALNSKAVDYAVMAGVALQCEIRESSVFARKNYFYPDLPKGYQISQFEKPLCENGKLKCQMEDGSEKTIGITRIHMEEDAGKSMHEAEGTSVDLNRACTPLIEIVSEPDMRNSQEASAYLKKLHAIVTYLGICDGNMQEGNFRCDANVSIRPRGQEKFGTRAELKNLNSFRFVEKAINYEIERQIDLVENGEAVSQETRGYDSVKGITFSMRSKEESHDYRYFPEPDLITLQVPSDQVESITKSLPELPDQKVARLIEEFNLSAYQADVIASSKPVAIYFESMVNHFPEAERAKLASKAANWLMTEWLRLLNDNQIEVKDSPVPSKDFADLILLVEKGTISGKIGKTVFQKMWESSTPPQKLIEKLGLKQVSDPKEIEALIDQIIGSNPKQVEQYRSGKDKLFGFFVGQVMKESKGKANPQITNEMLRKKLAK